MLSIFVNENRNDWDDHLPYVMMAYRSSLQESTGCTPNMLFLGREITMPVDIMFGWPNQEEQVCPVEYVEWARHAANQAYEFARKNLKKSTLRQARLYNRFSDVRSYEVGDWVWRWYPPKAKQKLGKGWTGPYLVIRKLTDIGYVIQATESDKSLTVHVDQMKRFISDFYPENWLNKQVLDESDERAGSDSQNENQGDIDNHVSSGNEFSRPGTPTSGNSTENGSQGEPCGSRDAPIAVRRSKRARKPKELLDL
jgi:hypothetical protein